MNVSLNGLEITKFLIIAKSVEKSNKWIDEFRNTYKFFNNDIKKFILLSRKGVYRYEYMDSWERFNETTIPNKKAFYCKLYLEDITNKHYIHA